LKHLLSALVALTIAAPAIAAPVVTDLVIEGSQRPIPATITLPEGAGPFPFVVLYHGTGSNRDEAGGGYDLLAPALAEAGIASAAFDFAGNGESTVDYTEYTFSSGIADGLDVVAHMRSLVEIDDARLGVAGWSQGGTIAMLTAARHADVQSLVTWAGALDMSGFAPELYEEAQKNGSAVLTFEWREPLNISKAWFDEARATDVAKELGNYQGATLAIAAGNGQRRALVIAELLSHIGGAGHPRCDRRRAGRSQHHRRRRPHVQYLLGRYERLQPADRHDSGLVQGDALSGMQNNRAVGSNPGGFFYGSVRYGPDRELQAEGLHGAQQRGELRIALAAQRAIEGFTRHAGILCHRRHTARPRDDAEGIGDVAGIAGLEGIAQQFRLRCGIIEDFRGIEGHRLEGHGQISFAWPGRSIRPVRP
jgi:uncharacterized protein